jgi:hypothetical protein
MWVDILHLRGQKTSYSLKTLVFQINRQISNFLLDVDYTFKLHMTKSSPTVFLRGLML